ncbi:MAG: glycosyltransferase family 4 protein [Candidatus Rokubacteria bacterium]|nr:glycosyltransferase family 4 protein [Candidatus Rokubacteria bacterium]
MLPRVAVLAPFAFPSVRGNAVTVARITAGLRARGVELRVWDLSVTAPEAIEREVDAFRPATIHAFHAYRVGPQALRLARRAEIPLVVTITGTDANHDLFDPERAAVVRRVLEGAQVVTVFDDSIGAKIAGALPDVGPRLRTIPQSVGDGAARLFDLASRWALPADRVLFLFPGGVRPVKRPRLPLAPLGRLVARDPRVRLLYVGPVLDAREGEALLAAVAERPWARHLGAVTHAEMPSLLSAADVVLNCSESEGGMANSVLEALAGGRAVLAADIEGNRSLVIHEETGLLFRDEAELERGAARLVSDPPLRRRLGDAGRALVACRFPPAAEIDAYLDVFHRLGAVRSA